MKLFPPPKLTKSLPSGVKRNLREEVITSSPIIQRNKQNIKHTKNNFKKLFTILSLVILIKIMTLTAVKNIRNTTV